MVDIVDHLSITDSLKENLSNICSVEGIEVNDLISRSVSLYINLYKDNYPKSISRIERAAKELEETTEYLLDRLRAKINDWGNNESL